MNGVAPSSVVLFCGIVSLGILIGAVRMKLPEYNDNEEPLAFFKRSWKFAGICIGIIGFLAALKEMSHRY